MTRFKYLGLPLDQTDDDCLEIRQNIRRARKVWGQLDKILQIEVSDTQVKEIFYREVVQVVLLIWVIVMGHVVRNGEDNG